MTILDSASHDALVSLLWELKAAWQVRTGKEVLLTGLLLDHRELDRFCAEVAQVDDQELQAIVARIVTLRSSLAEPSVLDPDGPNSGRSGLSAPATGAAAAPRAAGATRFDRLRAGAVLVASLLVSAAAARYLLTDGGSSVSAATDALAVPSARIAERESAGNSTEELSSASASPPNGSVVASAGAAALSSSASTTTPLTLSDSDVVLRIHGSNTVGEKLCPALVDAFLRTEGATEIVTVPGSAPVEKTVLARLPGRARPIRVEIKAHGSTTAFADLASGSADLGQSSRRIKPDEVTSLADKHGDLSRPASEHVVALDGLAIIVNPQNPVTSLSIDQIAAVFAGNVKNWSELGGLAAPIVLYARDDASGTWDTFKHLVLVPAKLELEPSARRVESSSDLSDAVAGDIHGIGFIGLPYVRRSKPLSVSAQVGGFALVPTPFTVGTEDYPLSRRLYFYAPAASTNETMREFVDFALSDPGQKIVKETGFVSQNVELEEPRIDATVPGEYRRTVAGSERMSLNFRFETGSENLDGKGLRDLDRVVAFLDRDRGREILLFGFTDDRGDTRANVALSRKRAEVVARALEARGVYSRGAHGFGEILPVASNATDEGRNRNRRVEVWVR